MLRICSSLRTLVLGTFLGLILSLDGLVAQQTLSHSIVWDLTVPSFEDALTVQSGYMAFAKTEAIDYPLVSVALKAGATSVIDLPSSWDEESIPKDWQLEYNVSFARKRPYLIHQVVPYRLHTEGKLEILKEYELVVKERTAAEDHELMRDPPIFAEQSVLRNGQIYKIAVRESGVHAIDASFLRELGVDIDNISTANINIYGNGSGKLPEWLCDSRKDDVQPVQIMIDGGDDGRLDDGDKIIFYANGPHTWSYDEDAEIYRRNTNIYDDLSYYFIKIEEDGEPAHRVGQVSETASAQQTIKTMDHIIHIEDDRLNVLADFVSTNGSGQRWLGDIYTNQRSFDYSDQISVPDAVIGGEATVNMEFLGRGNVQSQVFLRTAGQEYVRSMSSIVPSNSEATYARVGRITERFELDSDNPQLIIEYPRPSSATLSEGWLDFVTYTAERELKFRDDQMAFRSEKSLLAEVSEYVITDLPEEAVVLDVSGDEVVSLELERSGDQASFSRSAENIREYVAFLPGASLLRPTAVGRVANQNLHAISDAEMIVVYHPAFEEQALRLAEHRAEYSDLKVYAIPLEQVFNEFSSGMRDPTAIRDMCKMIYDRNESFKYLLLFGDGSYDERGRYDELADQNFIPVYETPESLDPIDAFPSDDYYALLDDEDGDILQGLLDIAVGRLPARTAEEAQIMVDKIIRYDTDEEGKGEWRLRVGFIADDEDTNTHIDDAEGIASLTQASNEWVNKEKIYLDAYQQLSTPGGERYPDVTSDIDANIFKGLLVTNYIGHGGNLGWAQERILAIGDIRNWQNRDKLTLLVTATCSFMAYDDPAITSGGEHTLINANGGAVALFSTVRSVFSSSNERLTREVFKNIFVPIDGKRPAIAEIMRRAKNANFNTSTRINSRKFTVFGDPAMPLAIPMYDVVTTSINGVAPSEAQDTLSALEQVEITGEVRTAAGELANDYNGELAVTIFDKKTVVNTLVNDSGSRLKEFETQKNVVFKGNARVINGIFELSFVVPRDINLSFGNGKISYYAKAVDQPDAKGAYSDIIVGGSDPDPIIDDQGPIVNLYLDDRSFVSGDETGPSPLLIVDVEDDYGINVVGNSIGHDLTGVLDGDRTQEFVLNEFFVTELDLPTKGSAEYPLKDLVPGPHHIAVKAWDVANNSTEAEIDFFVASDFELFLDYVEVFPNPSFEGAQFGFGHNLADMQLDIRLVLFDMAGRVIDEQETSGFSDGGRVSGLQWDRPSADMPDGVYSYLIEVSGTPAGSDTTLEAHRYGKLILLDAK